MSNNLIHLNDENFNSEVNAAPVIVVDFWATWCGPCRALGPTIEALADEFAGKVKIAKCNVDDSPSASAKWRIQSIPAIIAFRNGVEVGRVVGNAPAKVRDLVTGLL
ncbi:MAG: thioredoxin [Proteobacteria bacterium]|nr:thioredoxin [Pseudomonadota bacterium]